MEQLTGNESNEIAVSSDDNKVPRSLEEIYEEESTLMKDIEILNNKIDYLERTIETIVDSIKLLSISINKNIRESAISEAQERFYKLNKIGQVIAIISGQKNKFQKLEKLGEKINDEQVDDIRKMFK